MMVNEIVWLTRYSEGWKDYQLTAVSVATPLCALHGINHDMCPSYTCFGWEDDLRMISGRIVKGIYTVDL
jgi:hypothetical protein